MPDGRAVVRSSARGAALAGAAAWALVAGACGDDAGSAPPGAPSPAPPPAGRAFVDVAAEADLGDVPTPAGTRRRYIPDVKALGVAIFDYDGDDRPDVMLTAGSTVERLVAGADGFPVRLFRNVTPAGGALRFEDATARARLPAARWANGPCVADYDGDGDLDVLLTGFEGARLWRNRGDGTFEDATEAARLRVDGWSTGAAWGDLDGDGDLDAFVARYLRFDPKAPPVHGARYTCLWRGKEVLCGPRGLPPERDVVLRNDGDGGFTDVTDAWGFAEAAPQYGLGVLVEDFDRDGRPDVFVANDSSPSHLWWNEGGRFVEGAFESGTAYAENGSETAGMGVDAADVDDDGLPDLVVTNFEAQPNSLFVSEAPRRRLESSRAFGVLLPTLTDTAWGCGFEDFDLDGDLDLFTANGHVYPEAAEPGVSEAGYRQPCRVLVRDGARFRDASATLGAAFAATKRVGRGAAFGDLDADGDVDVVVVNLDEPPCLFENRGPPSRAYLAARLSQPGANREALGARVRVTAGGRTVERVVRRNRSFQASDEARRLFGLGSAPRADRVEVVWPDGVSEDFGPFDAGARVDLRRGEGRR